MEEGEEYEESDTCFCISMRQTCPCCTFRAYVARMEKERKEQEDKFWNTEEAEPDNVNKTT